MTDRERMFQEKAESLRGLARDRGMRMTHQRMEILRFLCSTPEHPSAEMVFDSVRRTMPTISLDTVYRTLGTLERYGLAMRVPTGTDQARFDADVSPHHHFVCRQCKSVQDFSWEDFDAMAEPEALEKLGDIHDKQIIIRGICRSCLNKPGN